MIGSMADVTEDEVAIDFVRLVLIVDESRLSSNFFRSTLLLCAIVRTFVVDCGFVEAVESGERREEN
jgi:hypothetical protein